MDYNLNNYLEEVVSPALNPTQYAQGMTNMVETINANFKKIIGLPFIQGDAGESVVIIKEYIYEAGTNYDAFTDFGKELVKAIYKDYLPDDYVVTTYSDLREYLSENNEDKFDAQTTGYSCDFLEPKTVTDIYNEYQQDADIRDDRYNYITMQSVGEKKVSDSIYFFADLRTTEEHLEIIMGNPENSEMRQQFDDRSCGIYCLYENGQWTLTRNYMLPRFYWDEDLSMFCWKLNNLKTHVTAQGIPGEAGQRANAYICKGTASVDVNTTPYRIELSEIWAHNSDPNIPNWDWVTIPDDISLKNSIIGVWFKQQGSDAFDGFVIGIADKEGDKWVMYYQEGDNGGINMDFQSIINHFTLKTLLDQVGLRDASTTLNDDNENTPARARGLYIRESLDRTDPDLEETAHIFAMSDAILNTTEKHPVLTPAKYKYTNTATPNERMDLPDPGDLTVNYNTQVTGELTVAGDTTIGTTSNNADLTVNGVINPSSNTTIGNDINIGGVTTIEENLNIKGKLVNTFQVHSDYEFIPCVLIRPMTFNVTNNNSTHTLVWYMELTTCMKYVKTEGGRRSRTTDGKYYFGKKYLLVSSCNFNPRSLQELSRWSLTYTIIHNGIKFPWKVEGNEYPNLNIRPVININRTTNTGSNFNTINLCPGCCITNHLGDLPSSSSVNLFFADIFKPTSTNGETYKYTFHPGSGNIHESVFHEGIYEFLFPIDSNGKIEGLTCYKDEFNAGGLLTLTAEGVTPQISIDTADYNGKKIGTSTNGKLTSVDLYSYNYMELSGVPSIDVMYPNIIVPTAITGLGDSKGAKSIGLMTLNFWPASHASDPYETTDTPLWYANIIYFEDAPVFVDFGCNANVDFTDATPRYLTNYIYGGGTLPRNELGISSNTNSYSPEQAKNYLYGQNTTVVSHFNDDDFSPVVIDNPNEGDETINFPGNDLSGGE